jgi:hypothetical protein
LPLLKREEKGAKASPRDLRQKLKIEWNVEATSSFNTIPSSAESRLVATLQQTSLCEPRDPSRQSSMLIRSHFWKVYPDRLILPKQCVPAYIYVVLPVLKNMEMALWVICQGISLIQASVYWSGNLSLVRGYRSTPQRDLRHASPVPSHHNGDVANSLCSPSSD